MNFPLIFHIILFMIITPKVVGLRQISWVIRDNYSQGRGSATNLVLKNNPFNPCNPLFFMIAASPMVNGLNSAVPETAGCALCLIQSVGEFPLGVFVAGNYQLGDALAVVDGECLIGEVD